MSFDSKADNLCRVWGGFAVRVCRLGLFVSVGCLGLHLIPAHGFGATISASYSLTLSWDSTPNPEVVGYRMYYGGSSQNYTNSITADNTTSITISGLVVGVPYYFAVTAFNGDGQESDFSEEISYTRAFPEAQMQILNVSGGQFKLTMTGQSARSYDIQATVDLKTWTTIGTMTAGADGTADFTDTNAASFPQRFYRTMESP